MELKLKIDDRLVDLNSLAYTLNLSDEMSIGVYYSQAIYLISDQEVLDISIEDCDIFRIIDISKVDNKENINDILYTNIDDITCSSIISNGSIINNKYIHPLYIYAKSDNMAEYVADITIDNDIVFRISGAFHPIIEEYEIQLRNIGCRFPQDISKAIFEGNLFNDDIDYILLNRKYKELLLNSIDIIHKKGSWKSIIDSFNWFGWEDIAHLREYWKRGNHLVYQDLCSEYITDFDDNLNDILKSTYISIYYCINKDKSSGAVEDEWSDGLFPEPVHQLEDNYNYKYTEIELMLKLMMLGNYFSSFFVPIHMDLLSSTVERISRPSTTIKYTSTNSITKNILVNNMGSCKYNFSSDYTMRDVEVGAGENTNLRSLFSKYDLISPQVQDTFVVGVEDMSNIDTGGNDNWSKANITANYYSGMGTLLNISTWSEEKIVSMVINITTDEGVMLVNSKYPIYKSELDDELFYSSSNILFKKTGKYTITITPITQSSLMLSTKQIDIEVEAPRDQGISITKIIKKPIEYDFITNRIWESGKYIYKGNYIEENGGSVKFINIDNTQFNLLTNTYEGDVYNSIFNIKDDDVSHSIIHIKLEVEEGDDYTTFKIPYNIYYYDGSVYTEITNMREIIGKFRSADYILDKLYSYGYPTTYYENGTPSKYMTDNMYNYFSMYMWWIRSTVLDDGEVQAYLIGMRVVTNDIVSAYRPKLFAGNGAPQLFNSDNIFYKNTYQPIMWKDSSLVTREFNLGEVLRIDPIFQKYSNWENNTSYSITNKSTNKSYDISALSHPIINTSRLGVGIYDIEYNYVIPSTSGDIKYTYYQENAFKIS